MSAPRKPAKKTSVQPTAPKRALVRKGMIVRFDSEAKNWGVLDPNTMNPVEHFEYGYMKNVTFDKHMIRPGMRGCGGHAAEYVGIAQGDLVVNRYHKDQKDLLNLGFNGTKFVDITSAMPLDSTPLLHLLPNRKALAKKS